VERFVVIIAVPGNVNFFPGTDAPVEADSAPTVVESFFQFSNITVTDLEVSVTAQSEGDGVCFFLTFKLVIVDSCFFWAPKFLFFPPKITVLSPIGVHSGNNWNSNRSFYAHYPRCFYYLYVHEQETKRNGNGVK
jgi:hypothetical protein